MTARCPKCSGAIAEGDLNVSANIARCAACNEVFPLSELVTDKTSEELASVLTPPVVDLNTPPAGVRYEQTFDGVIVSATTRSCFVIPMIPFICLWSGGSLSGIYGSQIMKGQFNPAMSLFGLPFLAGTVFLVGYVLMGIFGRVEIRLRGDDGEVFTALVLLAGRSAFNAAEFADDLPVDVIGEPRDRRLSTGGSMTNGPQLPDYSVQMAGGASRSLWLARSLASWRRLIMR